MDFRLTRDQEERRQEYFSVCAALEKEKPTDFNMREDMYNSPEGWAFNCRCAKEFAKRGWLALNWPKEYGGSGDMMDRVMFAEARGYHGIPGVETFSVQMLAPTLLAVGSEELKREFLPKIAAAEINFCQLWSEPNAGSDLADLSTTAIRHGNEFVINGQKTWTTGGHKATWGFGVFKSDPKGPKHHNLTFLILDMKTPGISVRPLYYMTGAHTYNEVFFDDVHVPARIVGKEGEGWAVVNTLAAFERSNIDTIMAMKRQIEVVSEYCNNTMRDGQLLAKNAHIRHELAVFASEVEAAKTLAYRVADLQNRKELSLMYAGAVKVFASELSGRFANFMTGSVLGPYGQVKWSDWAPLNGWWEQFYQVYFGEVISRGTNEIQRNIMAWYGLGLPRMK